jgi:hypothetical protein
MMKTRSGAEEKMKILGAVLVLGSLLTVSFVQAGERCEVVTRVEVTEEGQTSVKISTTANEDLLAESGFQNSGPYATKPPALMQLALASYLNKIPLCYETEKGSQRITRAWLK